MSAELNGDAIQIEEMELAAHVGVPDEERARPQRLTISITMWPRLPFDEMRDQIDRTINYAEVARAVKEFAESRADKLIETLAEKVALYILEMFPLRRVRVELRKFVLPETRFVAVICDRIAC